jgi:hypothetical protein
MRYDKITTRKMLLGSTNPVSAISSGQKGSYLSAQQDGLTYPAANMADMNSPAFRKYYKSYDKPKGKERFSLVGFWTNHRLSSPKSWHIFRVRHGQAKHGQQTESAQQPQQRVGPLLQVI